MSLISCRNCQSPYCDGCNLYRLEGMLKSGKLNGIMNENHAVMNVSVRPDVEAAWVYRQSTGCEHCSSCGAMKPPAYHMNDYCGRCGARMKKNGLYQL